MNHATSTPTPIPQSRNRDHLVSMNAEPTLPYIDNLNDIESNPLSVEDATSPIVIVFDDALFINVDPDHSFQAIHEQIFGSNDTTPNPAPMNDFMQQAVSVLPGMAETVMSV